VFDLSTGEGRILRDVFQAESAFLETISQLSRNALIASLGESADTGMIDQGTTPYEDNFQAWYLDGDAFVILFPPYQVAPYSAGRQKVEIPLSELASVLK
jgi:hypothetical protein